MPCAVRLLAFAAVLMVMFVVAVPAMAQQAKPLKIYILAGQSNMQGHAAVRTFPAIGMDPKTAPMLKDMTDDNGNPRVLDKVWIYEIGSGKEEGKARQGKLDATYGVENGGPKIGPEYTFGIYTHKGLNEPILLIKTAWGGKSLNTDFRPPSAGAYEFIDPNTPEDKKKERADATGVYYRLMMEHVKKVLADPGQFCPAYDPKAGYEIAGFVWFQGWNDMVDRGTYPNRNQPDGYAKYSEVLAHFIRDVRKDLNAPKMPFVIGVLGVGGPTSEEIEATRPAQYRWIALGFRRAMAAPAEMPEFKNNVVAVETAPFWSDELGVIDAKRAKVSQMRYFLNSKHKDHANADGHMTDEQKNEYIKKFEADLISPAEVALWNRGASNAGYHYLGCAKTFALMGKHFAEANLALMRQENPN